MAQSRSSVLFPSRLRHGVRLQTSYLGPTGPSKRNVLGLNVCHVPWDQNPYPFFDCLKKAGPFPSFQSYDKSPPLTPPKLARRATKLALVVRGGVEGAQKYLQDLQSTEKRALRPSTFWDKCHCFWYFGCPGRTGRALQ